MGGRFTDQGGLFSHIAPDKRVPAAHRGRQGHVCQWHHGTPGLAVEGETQGRRPPHHGR